MNKINKTNTLREILANRKFSVDYFQREYRWGKRQIEQMLSDFQSTFEEFYVPSHDIDEVEKYGYYYMGCIVCTDSGKIIDGQQRLTSLTLLLIYLNNLQHKNLDNLDKYVNLDDLIFATHFGKKHFNIDVPERDDCMHALFSGNESYIPCNESTKTMWERYNDIDDLFPEEYKKDALPFFIYWLVDRVLLLEIDTPSEDEAHTIFLTMNDRGLSLNSAEMMKAYVIQQVPESERLNVNHKWQENINRIKNASGYSTSGIVSTEDVDFISMWLRAKYAMTMRDTKRGAKDEDYELLGEKFHTWVRNYAKDKMGLKKGRDFYDLVMTEMPRVTDLYLRIQNYSQKITTGYEEVFYNANRDLTYQCMLAVAAIRNDDPEDIVKKKIQMTAKFIDDFASIRIFNLRKVNWNTNKYMLFHVLCDVRDQDLKTVGMVYVRALRRMDAGLEGITQFSLNRFSKKYMLHFLARFTSYINLLSGNPSRFEEYTDRKRQGNTYDIEHILPDKYDEYKTEFSDPDDFEASRQRLGNLIILTRDKNRSYQAMPYTQKVQKYAGDNILAQALNPIAYTNNPQFLKNAAEKYGFQPVPQFSRQSISDRTDIYLRIAADIWNPNDIKDLAGGWSAEEEKDFFKNLKGQEYTVGYADRSWGDALKYGFLSANCGGRGSYLYNVQKGDTVFCHITGYGFVGIGECTAAAVPMLKFKVDLSGREVPIGDAPWVSENAKKQLNPQKEIFIRVRWIKFVTDPADGYWEKGLVSVPLVAYTLSDKTTYQKVKEHFGLIDE